MQPPLDDVAIRHLARVVESTDDAIVSKDLNGIITSWNRAAERTFGYTAAEAIGQSIRMIIPADRQGEEDMVLARIRTGEGITHFDTIRQRKDGTLIPISLTVSPIRDDAGQVIGASKIARDISDRLQGVAPSQRLAAIVESSDDAIVSKDLNGIVTSWNRAAERMFGYTASEAIGQSIRMLIPDDLQHEEDHVLARIRAGEAITHFETIRRTKDGRLVPISLTVSPIVDASGTVIGASKMARDISDRVEAAVTARQLAAVVESSDDAIVTKDLTSVITSWNAAAERIFGYTAAEAIGQSVRMLIPTELQSEEDVVLAKIRAGEKVDHYETIRQHKDGSRLSISLTVSPIRNDKGEIIGASKVARDITERKRLEAVLADLQRQRERILNAVGEGLYGIDRDGNIIFENPAAATMLGREVHEVIGQPAHSVMHHTRADGSPYPQSECRIYATLRDGVVRRVEDEVFWRKDGTSFPVGYMSTPMRDDAGDIVGALVSFRDVTERNQAEAAIQQLNIELRQRAAQLAEANKELESFSYSVSHDLRAPLRHVQGYIDMLHRATDGQLSEQAQRYLNTIREASMEMGQLIDDLLAFSRMGRTEIKESPVRLDEAVQDTIRGLEMATAGRNIVWQTAPLPAVVGDPSLLKQVLVNLIGNAVKYSRMRDPARIEIGCAGEEDGRIILFVRDNGAGFAMEYAHKLFGVFQRLHRAEEFEGTGIGLATVQRIVARHGGRVWAESAVDEGATFYFTLKPSASA